MVHKIFKTLLAAVVATITFCAEADTETVNGIKWTYFVKNGEASRRRRCPSRGAALKQRAKNLTFHSSTPARNSNYFS